MSEETSKFEWVKVAKIEDIPKNEGRAFPVGSQAPTTRAWDSAQAVTHGTVPWRVQPEELG